MTTDNEDVVAPTSMEDPVIIDTSDEALHRRQPRGLYVLFFVEMWERLSYYGMRSFLVLYMVAPVVAGGLGFETARAGQIYGLYISVVFFTALLGGWLSDRCLGAKLSVLIGGIIIACGHFVLAFPAQSTFFLGLCMIAVGTGLLKPCMSTMVGMLYKGRDDPRRDGGYSIFYMGINLGALLAPLVCGTLAQSATFKLWLSAHGYAPENSWHWGFAASGIGMVLGLIQFIVQNRLIADIGRRPVRRPKNDTTVQIPPAKLTSAEWRQIGAIGVSCCFSVIFWAAYEQAGTSLNLFAYQLTRLSFFGITFPSSWLQMANPLFIILGAPLLAALWSRQGARQPSAPAKFACSLAFVGVGFLVMVVAALLTAEGQVSPWWLIVTFAFHTAGELHLNPVGLSLVSKTAPPRYASRMMVAWYWSIAMGNYVAGWVSGFFGQGTRETLIPMFGGLAAVTLCAAVILFLLKNRLNRLLASR